MRGGLAIAALVASVAIALACGDSEGGTGGPEVATGVPAAPEPTQAAPTQAATPAQTVAQPQTPAPPARQSTATPTRPASTQEPVASPTPAPQATPAATPAPTPPTPDDSPRSATPGSSTRVERTEEGVRRLDQGEKEPPARGTPPAATDTNATDTNDQRAGSPPQEASSPASAPEDLVYTWHDGDRIRRVTLAPDLVVQPSANNTADDTVVRDYGETSIVQKQDRHSTANAGPVFRSGLELLTLPGGVVLVLDGFWDTARVNRFFSDNGISMSAVEAQRWAVNAFLIETAPGFPSLNLANRLAALEGVEISSPNWGRELVIR